MKKSLLTAYLKNQQKDNQFTQSFEIGDLTLKDMEEVQEEVVETTEVPTPEVEVAAEVAPEVTPEVTEEVAE